jgi:transcriptional regulator with GAF, ATPase, and Fis domain
MLLDLGLSAEADAPTSGGTPRYLPPELFAGGYEGDGSARDRFALGLVLAELLAPELAAADDLAAAARAAVLPPPFEAWCRALLAPNPGARPRASWLAKEARAAARAAESDGERAARHEREIRSSYLAARRAEVTCAARARSISVLVGGSAGGWLRRAIEITSKAAALRGSARDGEPVELRDADPFTRVRWLVKLVGEPASTWPGALVADRTDEAWVASLTSLAGKRPPASLGFVDLERAFAGTDAGGPEAPAVRASSPVELALALADRERAPLALEIIERDPRAPAELRRAAAGALCRMGETGRALALVDGDEERTAGALRADIARRAGDRGRAEREALAVLELHSGDGRAQAVLARLAVDSGDPKRALELLSGAPSGVHTAEARALALIATGDREAAERELSAAEVLASTEEQRGRVAGLVGWAAHQSGDAARSLEAFIRASDHAARAGALVDEATYRTGEAAAAVDCGKIGRGLAAARRATLLWEHLGRPREAAQALINHATALATAGATLEAISAAHEARERARWLGHRRAEAFACWALTDVLETGHPDAVLAARSAQTCVEGGENEDDRLRALARLLRHAPGDVTPERIAWGDAAAARDATLTAARLEWWTVRAGGWLEGRGAGRRELPVVEICHLLGKPAAVASRGPALAAARALAARMGDGQAMRLLARAEGEAARELLAGVPPELREAASSLPWVRSALTAEPPEVSAEQIADFEVLVRALGARDRLRPLLDQVLDTLVLWTGVERGLLLLTAPNGRLVPRAARNLARADLSGQQLLLSQSLAQKAMELREPVVAVDAAGEMPSLHASVHALKLRSVLAIPLLAKGEALGVVYLDDRVRRGAFGVKELAWVRLVASLAAIAIADARDQILLRRAARRAERSKQALARELARSEAERDVMGQELARARDPKGTRFRYDAIVGKSTVTEQMLRIVDRVTLSEVPVLLIGESGSGKELVARAIHKNGPRGKGTFVGENCAAIPEPLLESTLFGHARGAFTGADRPRAGLFEIAHRGTLFLDEVGEMSLPMQAKLLRVLEEGVVRPLGAERGRPIDVRVIAATHRNLDEMVKAGRFREDLFYRLNVISVRVPPLRERADDIPLLVHHFIEKHGAGSAPRVSAEAMSMLKGYAWPGNVRQLENEVRRALVLSDGVIGRIHLSAEVSKPDGQKPIGLLMKPRVDALETELVETALLETRGNQTRAAELLGLSRFGLQKMIKRLGIKTPA